MNFDRDRSGTVEPHELQQALVAFGYNLSPQAMGVLVRRYSIDGRTGFDDFVACCIRLRALTSEGVWQDVQSRAYWCRTNLSIISEQSVGLIWRETIISSCTQIYTVYTHTHTHTHTHMHTHARNTYTRMQHTHTHAQHTYTHVRNTHTQQCSSRGTCRGMAQPPSDMMTSSRWPCPSEMQGHACPLILILT